MPVDPRHLRARETRGVGPARGARSRGQGRDADRARAAPAWRPRQGAALVACPPGLQPPRLRDRGWAERLAALGADLGVVVAFGQILPKAVLDAPARGSINIHASLLPRYRGAAPIQWAIIR